MTTACIITAVLILVAGLFAVIVERTTERDDARVAAERLEREAESLQRRLAEAELAAGRTPRALRIVPASREVTGYEWPAIARVLEIDGGDDA